MKNKKRGREIVDLQGHRERERETETERDTHTYTESLLHKN